MTLQRCEDLGGRRIEGFRGLDTRGTPADPRGTNSDGCGTLDLGNLGQALVGFMRASPPVT